jgi:hypothetical protein
MLIGIEFKRTKVTMPHENRTVWFWRVAPYLRDVDANRVGAFFVVLLGVLVLSMLPSCTGL